METRWLLRGVPRTTAAPLWPSVMSAERTRKCYQYYHQPEYEPIAPARKSTTLTGLWCAIGMWGRCGESRADRIGLNKNG
jgi:hypothetical protein